MRKSICSLLITGMVFGSAAVSLQAQPKSERQLEKKELDARAADINATVKREKKDELAIRGVSNETGVPVREVEAMYEKHKTASGILIACVLADETKKAPEVFLHERFDGKGKTSWTTLANENHVSLEKINERLAHLERDLARGVVTDEKRVKIKRHE